MEQDKFPPIKAAVLNRIMGVPWTVIWGRDNMYNTYVPQAAYAGSIKWIIINQYEKLNNL